MAHGYLGDGYGTHGEFDPDRDDDRERGWRERERGMMFRDRGRTDDDRWSEGRSRREASGQFGDRSEGWQRFSANPDDHYRSWRDRHMSELDRDYADFCREREQQFHRDFDDWRSQRRGVPQPLRTGMTQSGLSADPSGITEAENETMPQEPNEADPMATATLGTNARGRGRR